VTASIDGTRRPPEAGGRPPPDGMSDVSPTQPLSIFGLESPAAATPEEAPGPARSTVADLPGPAPRNGRHHKPTEVVNPEDTGVHLALELQFLSDGKVARVAHSGPTIKLDRGSRRLRPSTFSWALTRFDRILVAFLSLAWLACLVFFWTWWLQPGHRVGVIGEITNSLVLSYVSCFPAFFVAAVNRLRRVRPDLPLPLLRVAFIVTRAPSEPWALARETLTAMQAQDFPYPYDVWLCDEQPTEVISAWCESHGVHLSTRAGVRAYHRANWPRRTRCKEGNLAYFYDRHGYRSYDVVAQLDCDHVPAPGYLADVVRAFADPAIGYVAAPSVCDSNAAQSWSARGRLYKEATFHGPFQLGHSDGFGPLCIGSHYAVRTSALREIGGIGPDLAEDFSTTFLLSSAGWQGAFAIDAEAHGFGPSTFGAMAVQEYQWARSLTTVLLGLVPRNIRRLRWRLRLRFLYALSYYGLLVSTTLVGLALPPVAAVTGRPWIKVNYGAFLLHWWSISLWLLLIALLLRRRGLLRPPRAPLVSWENWLYSLTRWPFVAFGICAAALMKIWPRDVVLKVTPKGSGGLERMPVRLVLPFAVVSVVASLSALFGERYDSRAAGYVGLSMLAALTYALVTMAVPVLHAREAATAAGASVIEALRRTVLGALSLAAVSLIPAVAAAVFYPAYVKQAFGL
jgi:cellulose synthase (UDP-forming)